MRNKATDKYYLGLDIGIGSVGWGIIGEENGEHWLEDFGVRLFQVPEESKNKKSLAEKRREFRGKRRSLNRWHRRREELKNLFGKIFGDDFLQEFENFTKKSTNLLEGKYDEVKFFNPYVIRNQALSDKIKLVELLWILLHIGKYRGYKEFYLDNNLEEKDEESKKAYVAVGEVKKIFRENNYISVAEMVIKNEKFRHSKYKKDLLSPHNHNPNKNYENKEEVKKNHKHFIFPREFLVEETQKILEKQSEYYPQLKRKFSYTLWENGKSEKKEFSAQKIIGTIIFRQRDFEDGPTKLEPKNWETRKEISHWKKHNRNIASKSFTETVGYCQYFPNERRGWRCSIIYCCYQFLNEFSKIGGLEEKELGGLEKVKEIHQQVFEWLLSDSGYQSKTLSQQEKTSGKKRETLRKQLEGFLNKLVGKENYSFPKGIEFETDFLDYLKRNDSFYSALWKNCSPYFYLNYEEYQKTIFYQIGQIIFEKITPRRRKNELSNLSQKTYSLEAFQDTLVDLEKYDKKRSPASVSFRYMIETVKAFLKGQKYGEFQAEVKKELEEKLESSKNGNKNKKIWSPWMHPDLVRNPVVFRSFNQTRKILKNLFLNYPQGFATINIETGRDLWNSEEERIKIERKNQDQAKEKKEIVEKLKDNNSDIQVNEENIKRYRLWEDQNEKLWVKKKRGMKKVWVRKTTIGETKDGGTCLYCSKEIDMWKLKDTQIDHIIPQSKWANDSFNNLTLTHLECNQNKGENLPFHFFQKYKTKKEWLFFKKMVDNLYKTRNPFKHKFLTLGEKEGWEEELEDFVSRNLNDTRHIAIKLKQYIRNELDKKAEYQKTEVQLIKGSLTSYFRKQLLQYKEGEKWQLSPFYYKDQLRSLISYHHAIDAIVLAHFKSRGYIQLLEDLTKISQSRLKLRRQKINQNQFNSLSREISEKWKKTEWKLKKYELLDQYTQNAAKIIENAIQQKEINISHFFPISNLRKVIEQRIPVQLEKVEKEPEWDQEEQKGIKEVIIEVKRVLTESEYYERVKGQKGNIHYPYISWNVDQKVKEEFIASEQVGYRKRGEKILPDLCEKLRNKEKLDLSKNISLSELITKIGLEKLNSEYGEKYNFLVVKDKENNCSVWDTSKYAGFGVRRNNNKAEKIKNIVLLHKKKNSDRNWLTENYKWLLRPYETFTFNYSESLENELMKLVGLPLIYTGTTVDRVLSINIVGLVYDKKENLQNIYPEHGDKIIKVKNNINFLGTKTKSIKMISPSIKLLKIDILGKREK
ncbi:MAG: type II CRISPR RNA-guided endonuclease Cas9 [Candidatus Moeniiplasma glomeromycotorum]|nr:type II CRISPR RNA-guided endonuclease Cas9 [Candidatus Moeniiplasma glomeromycotorum]MCE8167210.1 type II CRISPR RNA-guided endonuclease Cas9 [Candidatus Moeniiplasma glomeromycotorum]MCE8168777.1 type II CRISPR RNA-guided endonuclease Cas9 [Candidatus Moeniiplasma glomeromycotorum]